jgi:omega-6 fatty acid desaturase (delta-12 desaturase)
MPRNAAEWNRVLAAYSKPDVGKSVRQLAMTLAMFVALVVTAHLGNATHWAVGLPFSLAAGIVIVRLFIIQHDCGHRSFFRNAKTCDMVGRGLSLFTLTPYGFWRRDHDKHHATSGHLDRRGIGDIDTLTVEEYRARGSWGRLAYRIYRHPLFLFGLGPSWQFLLRYRLPIWLGRHQRWRNASSILVHDAALAAFFGMLCLAFGWAAVATVWLPAILVAATVGVWLFYVQHQFEDTYWERTQDWEFVDAALQGCSFYRLPGWMHWLTGWIGYHHIHHLSSRIPNYRLAKVFEEVPELRSARSIGILESLRMARLALWCERRRRLVSFAEAVT